MDNHPPIDGDKARIRSEEIYRAEVRRELETNSGENNWFKTKKFLNSPFAIWLLTSIGIGMVSFFYSQWSDQREQRIINEQQATRVFFESQFRIQQFDVAIENSQSALKKGKEEVTTAMLHLFTGIKLGGITSFPLSDKASEVWVNGSGKGNQALPLGRGYQDDEFRGYSILSLWYSFHSLTCGDRPNDERVEKLKSGLLGLNRLVVLEIDYDNAIRVIAEAQEVWNDIRDSFGMFLLPGPRFDAMDYC